MEIKEKIEEILKSKCFFINITEENKQIYIEIFEALKRNGYVEHDRIEYILQEAIKLASRLTTL